MNQRSSGFFSEALQQAIDDSKHILENYAEIRNQVSNDIKELESYLDSLSLREEICFSLGKGFYAIGEEKRSCLIEDDHSSLEGKWEEKSLVWKPDDKGRFRLYLDRTEWDAFFEDGIPGGPYHLVANSMRKKSKPLIEWPFNERKQTSKHLQSFVRYLAQCLSSDVESIDSTDDEDVIF